MNKIIRFIPIEQYGHTLKFKYKEHFNLEKLENVINQKYLMQKKGKFCL